MTKLHCSCTGGIFCLFYGCFFFFFFFLARVGSGTVLHGMKDFSSQTRDRTSDPFSERTESFFFFFLKRKKKITGKKLTHKRVT